MKNTILIIEDEGGIVDNIAYALRTDGFDSHWRSTGAEGLAAAQTGQYQLVILDVGLPDINGFELFKELKKLDNLPVIFLTARSEEVDRVVGLELGADDYVTKPFSPRELTARVKAVLRRVRHAGASPVPPTPGNGTPSHSPAPASGPENPHASSSLIQVGPLVCDDRRNTVFYHGQAVPASRYEYRIMKILIDHPGWVYTREQLMEKAWDEPDMSEVRTVDAHIKNLRRKFKAITPDCDPIITHRGSGYALREEW